MRLKFRKDTHNIRSAEGAQNRVIAGFVEQPSPRKNARFANNRVFRFEGMQRMMCQVIS